MADQSLQDFQSVTTGITNLSLGTVLDQEQLNNYVTLISCQMLGVSQDFLYKKVHEEQNQTLFKTFANDGQSKLLIVSKLVPEDQNGIVGEAQIFFHLEIMLEDIKTHSIGFLKRQENSLQIKKNLNSDDKENESNNQVEANENKICNQLQVINLGYSGHDSSPFSIFHNYVQMCLMPLFTNYKTTMQQRPSSDKESYNSLLKKISELNLALIQCEQSVEVPEISLQFDPEVKQKVQEAKSANQQPKIESFAGKLNDGNFINSLIQCVAKWTQDISTVTKMNFDLSKGSTIQEINYWLSYQRSLNLIDQQLRMPEVDLTLELLKMKKKFQITTSFESDLNFKNEFSRCEKSTTALKDFPINDLISASTLQQVEQAIASINSHIKKIIILDSYTYSFNDKTAKRAVHLCEAVSRDINSQILKILSQQNVMKIQFNEFQVMVDKILYIYKEWDSYLLSYRELLRRNKGSGNVATALQDQLRKRVEQLQRIRRLHEKLKEVIESIISKESSNKGESTFLTTKEISDAYSVFMNLDVLDLSKEGENALINAIRTYEMKIDRVETTITMKLRDRLGSASNANEMFRIFSKFNALFFRPHIKGAIQEYQSQLLKTVQNDIHQLREKFFRNFANFMLCETGRISKLRDLPPTSSLVIWAKQVQRKLKKYMERVENVLGSKWHEDAEGKQLKELGEQFERKLNIQGICDKWTNDMMAVTHEMNLNHRLFDVVQKKDYEIIVNFDDWMISLFKEVRNFQWLKIKLSWYLTNTAKEVKQIYPFAVSLQESIHLFKQISAKVDDRFSRLIASHRLEVLNTISQGFGYTWQHKQLHGYVKKLTEKVLSLEEAVTSLHEKTDYIHSILAQMSTCEASYENFSDKLAQIQNIIDDFNFKDYSNLQLWVPELDQKIEAALSKRVVEIVENWMKDFENFSKQDSDSPPNSITDPSIHELKIQNQMIYIEPPLEFAKFYWMQQMHKQLGIICSLPRLEAQRFESSNISDQSKKQQQTYCNGILKQLPENFLQQIYTRINNIFSQAEQYVKTWLNYQALWEIDSNRIFEQLGDNIDNWHKLLNEIKSDRLTFDNSETETYFGPIVIDYRLVQAKINNKYDSWHKQILNQFGSTFSEKIKAFFSNISSSRQKLEKLNFQSLTADVTQLITEIQEVKRKYNGWNTDMENFRNGQKLLDRQRFQYPSDWLWLEQVEGEWSAFKQIYNRKIQQMENEIPNLKNRVISEEKVLNEKIKEIDEIWKNQRPYSGDMLPTEATEVLTNIQTRLDRVKDSYYKVCQAKDLLDLPPGDPQKLEALEEDVKGLKEVWGELNNVWSKIEGLGETPMNALVPKKLKQIMDETMENLQAMPSKLRQYEAFDKMRERMQQYKKMNMLIMELKNDSIKPRHWKQVLSKLRLTGTVSSQNDLTVQQLWNCEITKYEAPLREILSVARGELVLEDMLRKIKDYWNEFELEMVRYQNKCKLIKGWDELFQKLDEDLNNLQSMRMSPYFKSFEEEIVPWDEKLQKMRIIFDIWIDVQRRWVYLESIFFGSSDIKQQLNFEYTKFKGIDSEFTSLMKKVANKPLILDVIGIPEIQKTLERISDLLAKIQKALGDYLETKRQAFARFYFVGDEDLLDIIGNAKDVKNIQRHFPKMYAGITTLKELEGDILQGMFSREGETVPFEKDIKISDDPTIHIWLSKVDEQMRQSLASNLERAVKAFVSLEKSNDIQALDIIDKYPAQVVLLALMVLFCQKVETALNTDEQQENLKTSVESYVLGFLDMLAQSVMKSLEKTLRQKFEQIITDFVHQRDLARALIQKQVKSAKDFAWQYYMRFNFLTKEADPLKKLQINMSLAQFHYGFEYLGIGERLVQTPLTDKCYLTLTQALHLRMGGAPFGPAGTGKTESVKALGSQLGRFVLVFNCDESFDFHAMGRIFVGLCQVGAWGCFDEFNRLEERMLSAVSQQILTIQIGLREKSSKIELMGKDVKLNQQMGAFVTMNPGYAGRSNLPENLKQLFRQMAMVKPDRELIAQVMLYSQGYKTAEKLAGKIVSLFELCNDQLSSQPHYDFGLRALKSVLASAGNMKREEQQKLEEQNKTIDNEQELSDFEQSILLRSVCDTIVPKLVSEDIPLLSNLLSGVFPGSDVTPIEEKKLREALAKACARRNFLPEETFLQKVLQLYQILKLHHGVMMVGPSGQGKSAAWKVLIEAMYRVDKIKGESYIIDPKAISKEQLYGKLDGTTLEWTDGVFTSVLRKITENVRGEAQKRHWIIFDGDVDPEWCENLNSVLDDNKLLTLPNGERISIPPNVKIMFEVETLKYATLATVSRCGMVWFSDDTINLDLIFHNYLNRLLQENYDEEAKPFEEDNNKSQQQQQQQQESQSSEQKIRNAAVEAIRPIFQGECAFIKEAIQYAEIFKQKHVMVFTKIRVLEAMFALCRKYISNIIEYNDSHPDFPMDAENLKKYMQKSLLLAIMWGVVGSLKLADRATYSKKLSDLVASNPLSIELPSDLIQYCLIDYEVRVDDSEWHLWKSKVPNVEIDIQRVTDADLIITTVDTLRHQDVLCSWLSEHRPFLLCGPPGSGKTMTLMSTLKALPDFEMIFVNFSSSTKPALLIQQFDHYCEYVKTPNGTVLRPKQPNKWLVVFCDEINLPDEDKYGTMFVITFLRQLTEQRGFWRSSDKSWIALERIQFVGACNPPTDIGRHLLSDRFLRHCPLILVDFPGPDSLKQIYGTFNRAMLKKCPPIRAYADSLTDAMVEFYMRNQQRFTADIQPHYIFSPRELTRWKYALNEAIEPLESLEDLVRLWGHEALRLFQDRLVEQEEKEWLDKLVDEVAMNNFPTCNNTALDRPILFSTYLSRNYVSSDIEQLREYVQAKLKVFYEEELNVPIVVFDSVLEHIVRIDRVLRQPLGHLLLVGASGVGKTTLSRFVSWMNGLQVFQIKAGRNYGLPDFDNDLRDVMKRAGVKGEKITFIFDESNVLSVAFLERMNALLASGEVPGLFEGEEYMALINQCKDSALKDSKGMVETDDELYRTFIKNVQRNLHVVFTMNPANPDFSDRTASSPALFNRCVIDWFGNWTNEGLWQVAREFTLIIDPSPESFTKPQFKDSIEKRSEALVNSIVYIHNSVIQINEKLKKAAKKFNFLTPRDFLDFIKHFIELHAEKKTELEEQQFHLNVGLDKLKETESYVLDLQKSLDKYKADLEIKQKEANEKLQQMVREQKEAEQNKENSIKMSKNVEVMTKETEEKQASVEVELSEALPALEKAQKSVSNIQQRQLIEIRALANPPVAVKLTLEAVCCAIFNLEKSLNWGDVKKELQKSTFISTVLNFNTDNLKASVKDYIIKNYTSTKDWDVERIDRASKAAGPLALWIESQLKYADILKKIDPLRSEVKRLSQEQQRLMQQKDDLDALIIKLEKNIAEYQNQYALLITQVENIKQEMQKVQEKVARSQALINNLSSERTRWEGSSQNFRNQIATMPGDVLLSGAFLAYIGFFDHFYRKVMTNNWKEYLEMIGINFRKEISIIEFLSQPSEKLKWQSHKLPSDDLCTENAIILSRFHRYPLVIDPAGQALEFIISFYQEKKIARTSFADDSFLKNLETALRFGCPLLVQDVEKIDPILNSVLNKEIKKTGGRILIRVGDQEIDFSQNFLMFMITRDSNAKFTPDLCSRVTFVNFTVTPSSLDNQCLNIYLRNERPDVEAKRLNLLKLQGEYVVKLRQLEDSLLNALNNVEGNILDNEPVISTLETLKREAAIVTEQMAQSDKVMSEVQSVTDTYLELANATSKIYFSMIAISQVHYLYHFSLQFFMDTVHNLLSKNEKLNALAKTELDKRRKTIFDEIFINVYQRVCQSLLVQDKLIFALKLVQIKLSHSKQLTDQILQLIKTPTVIQPKIPDTILNAKLNSFQIKYLDELSDKEQFENLVGHVTSNENQWLQFFDCVNPEENIPRGWENEQFEQKISEEYKEQSNAIRDLTIIKLFRPDKFNYASQKLLINKVLGDKFMEEQQIDMKQVVDKETSSKSPILLCSAAGFDASYKVDQLAKEMNKKCTSVAIGSAEGFEIADKTINQAVKSGNWVLLKNIHLAPLWLNELEKKIHRLTNPHEKFRLFLSMEFNPKVPTTLIRQSYKLVFEPPDGIKASLLRTYKTVLTPQRTDNAPHERARLHFLLAWLHAVIQERLRYTPIGWTKVYEFNEADQRCALDLIDELIDQFGDRTNIDPQKLPWEALCTIFCETLYGGKIDNDYDNKILISLVEQFFSAKSFDPNYPLFNSKLEQDQLKMPDALKSAHYLKWIEDLPKVESPAWSGLPMNVERILKETQANRIISNLWELQDVNEEEITLSVDMEGSDKGQSEQQVQWLQKLGERVDQYLQILPQGLDTLNRTSTSISNPLFRFLEREVTVANNLLDKLRDNLEDLKNMCKGEGHSTNEIKQIAKDLHNENIPNQWKKFNCMKITANEWIIDYNKRLQQFNTLIGQSEYHKKGVWMGGLLFPEAYLTATRQYVAQNNKWSLEELELKIDIWDNQEVDDNSFLVSGMNIEGAIWDQSTKELKLTDDISNSLPTLIFQWIKADKESIRNKSLDKDQLFVPVYLNKARTNLLFSVKMKSYGISKTILYQKGLALIAWNN